LRPGFKAALAQQGIDPHHFRLRFARIQWPRGIGLRAGTVPTTPFLFVSGVIGDDVAVESLKAGGNRLHS